MTRKITMATSLDYDAYQVLYEAYGSEPFNGYSATKAHDVGHYRLYRLLELKMIIREDVDTFRVN